MANEITSLQAILTLRPNSQFDLRSKDGIDVLTWNDKVQTEPTQAEIDAEIIRLQAVYDAQEYARNRQPEYPTIAELTIALYDTGDKAALKTKRAAVKAKWPKDHSGPK